MERRLTDEINYFVWGEDGEQLKAYVAHLMTPDHDRTLLLTAHLVTERLLGDMIATKLRHPDVWLDEADFRSRTNLARAFGLIGDREFTICRVLNSARNCIAHKLDPLPDKWTIEIHRLAFGKAESSSSRQFGDALMQLVTTLAAPWLYARFHSRLQPLKKEHAARWKEIMAEKLRGLPDLDSVTTDDAKLAMLAHEVDILLARELVEKST